MISPLTGSPHIPKLSNTPSASRLGIGLNVPSLLKCSYAPPAACAPYTTSRYPATARIGCRHGERGAWRSAPPIASTVDGACGAEARGASCNERLFVGSLRVLLSYSATRNRDAKRRRTHR